MSALIHKREKKALNVYITDALKVIVDNTARYAGGNTLAKRWIDVIEPQPEPPKDDRTPEEVVDDIWAHGFGA